ncbi:hypothetical protein AOLI_G00063020 [Acnodon oligacanthus]
MTSLWKQFYDDVDQILEAKAKREADRKLQAMTMIIVSIAAEQFGKEEEKSSRTYYIKNQRAFTKDLLGQKRSGKLTSSQEKIDQHLTQTYSDPGRELKLGECNIFIDPREPEVQFDLTEMQLREVREVVHKARARFAPGPSCTSYKVYKNCPKLLLCLWKILQVFCRKWKIPEQWQVAEGVWIPQGENSTQLDQFCIISLLCFEAKILFSAISKRLCTYLTKNTYINTVQKAGISGMPGCVEHTSVVTQLIRERTKATCQCYFLTWQMHSAPFHTS